jgi:hypothetical protein
MGVAVSGEYAYVADLNGQLHVIAIADERNPREIGTLHTSGGPWRVRVLGDLAYVADYDRALRIVDVSDPAAPREIGSYGALGAVKGVDISGNLAYVAAAGEGLCVLDISDSQNPRLVGYHRTPSGAACDVCVENGYAYVACQTAGLQIYGFPDDGLWPRTTVVRGTLYWGVAAAPIPDSGFALVDALGRRVLRLGRGSNDISRLPSGLYFLCPMTPGGGSSSAIRKVVVTR